MPDPRIAETAESAVPAEPLRPPAHSPAWRRALALALRAVESRVFKIGFALAMVALGVYAVASQWNDFKSGLDRLGVMAAFEALLCVALAMLLTMQVWRSLLAAAGSRISLAAGSRIFFIGQLGKYLPGSVWPVLTQMELGRAYRIPRQRSATVAMLSMLIGLTSGLLAAVIGLPFTARDSAHHYWWVFLFIPVLLVFLHPRVLNPAIARGLRLLHKPVPERPLGGRAIATALVVNLGVWFAFGLQIWVMTARFGVHGGGALLGCIGAYSLAWAVGFVIVLAPAGVGPRDIILIATLTSMLHGSHVEAVAIALVSRGVTMLVDLGGAGIAALLSRGAPVPPPADANADLDADADLDLDVQADAAPGARLG
jgi:hypothetical protein